MTPIFCSFFTAPYAAEAAGLVESLNAHGLEHDVRPVPDLGSWRLNCGRKPRFLREMREQYPKRSIVWLDADARVVRQPTFDFGRDVDFAAHYFRGDQLASGTIYLGCTPESHELCRRWEWRQGRSPEALDQETLQTEAEAMPGLNRVRLPAAYCWIQDLSEELYPDVPVVIHRQASRTRKTCVA